MSLPIYKRADKLCERLCSLHKELQNVDKVRAKYQTKDDTLRSYKFICSRFLAVQQLNANKLYHSTLCLYGYKNIKTGMENEVFSLETEIDERFSTANNSVENEFQLSMIYDDYELLRMYLHAKLIENKSRLQGIIYVFLTTLDTIRITSAIKACKDFIDEQERKHNRV